MRRARMILALGLAAACSGLAAPPASAVPPIKHVFLVILENKSYDETFGSDSPAPYLAETLPSKGQLLTHYYGIGHESLDNYIALVSGQSPNPDTQSDCQFFTDFVLNNPAQPIFPGPEPPAAGQAWGRGCVYPQFITTIADQLQAQGLVWKGYMEDMGKDPTRDNGRHCAHPPINSRDNTQEAEKGDQYATRHNPFVYFHSILESRYCDKRDVPLSQLPTDLKQAGTTPKYSFIVPNLCHDGHDHPCVTGEPGGLVSANAWLKKWIPKILGSPAFKRDGLLIVTFDEAEDTGPEADSTACCDEPTGPNTVDNGGPTPGPGGGRVGAVVLSPFVKPGTVNDHPYNHYSLLRSVEDIFDLPFLGYARTPDPGQFGSDVYNR